MAAPHLVSVDKYLVFHSDAQRAAVHDHNINTVYDLFNAVWFDSDRLPRDPSRMYVLKGRLLGFLNAACRKTFIDLHALKRDKYIEFGGKYPDQFVALVLAKKCATFRSPVTVREKLQTLMISTKHMCEVDTVVSSVVTLDDNCGLSDEEALERALRESLVLTKPAPPDELCCPITLEPYRDPVSTIRGQTYERDAIVNWLRKSATDPITGCALNITTVWPDKEMRSRVEAFYAS